MLYLKADTSVEVVVGPAVSVSDGFTPVTTLSIASADEAELLKYNGATAVTATSITGTLSAISGADGYYSLDIANTLLDTEGFMVLAINDDSLILPIRHEFMVVNANVYDSLFAAAATDYLQTDIQQIGGDSTSQVDLKDMVDNAYNPVFNSIQANLVQISDSASAALKLEESTEAIAYSTADGTGSATTFGTSLEATFTTDDALNERTIIFTSGSLNGQARRISDYNGTNGDVTVDPAFTTTPSNGDVLVVV